ncbi:MAG: tetratricopeptide repeat protein [Rhodospirillales bacterium]|nr:tetratricopeptide repeat protein [Rhodospirillales bacterium]
MARAMEEQGRLDDAEDMLLDFRKHYPGQIDVLTGLARVAERQGDADKAIARWAEVRTKFPRDLQGYFEAQRVLEQAKRPREEIEAVVTQAIHNFPQDARPLTRFALLAHRAQDWEEAAARWKRLREAFPDTVEAYERGAEALRKAGRAAEADAVLVELAARRQT